MRARMDRTAMGLLVALNAGLTASCLDSAGPEAKSVSFSKALGTFAANDYQKLAAPVSGDTGADPGRTRGATSASMGGAPGAGGRAALPAAGTGAAGSGGSGAPMGGAGGAAGAGGQAAPPQPTGPAEGTLSVKLTSVDLRGRYSPRNCGAVWIETNAGEFVKTIERWCGFRAYYLERWTEASGGWGGARGGFPFGGGSTSAAPSGDQVDAVSSGTLRMHVSHESTWNLRDVAGELVPDGDYQVVIEVSDGDEASIEVPFTKGHEAAEFMPPDQPPCTGLVVEYKPNSTP